jgi:hypothetical protein
MDTLCFVVGSKASKLPDHVLTKHLRMLLRVPLRFFPYRTVWTEVHNSMCFGLVLPRCWANARCQTFVRTPLLFTPYLRVAE